MDVHGFSTLSPYLLKITIDDYITLRDYDGMLLLIALMTLTWDQIDLWYEENKDAKVEAKEITSKIYMMRISKFFAKVSNCKKCGIKRFLGNGFSLSQIANSKFDESIDLARALSLQSANSAVASFGSNPNRLSPVHRELYGEWLAHHR